MSHKLPGPAIGPFSSRSVYVDNESTSSVEDGSIANPYKTIQAALDAMPAPTSLEEAISSWFVTVETGFYREDLTIPASGYIYIKGSALVVLGDFSTPRDVSRTALTDGTYGQDNVLKLESIYITGDLTLIAAATVHNSLEMVNGGIQGNLVASGITTPGSSGLTMRDSGVEGTTDFNGICRFFDADLSDAVTIYRVQDGERTTFNTALTVTDELVRMTHCTVGAASLNVITSIQNTTFTGPCTQSGVGIEIIGCTFLDITSLDAINHINRCVFSAALTTTNACGEFDTCQFDGLATFAAGLNSVTNGRFNADCTVIAAGVRFVNCYFSGTFTGPVSSFVVDGATASNGLPTFAGGATLVLLTEIANDLSEKTSYVPADVVLLGDSAAGYTRKGIQARNLLPPVKSLPFVFYNVGLDFASLAADDADTGWSGGGTTIGFGVILEDGVNTKVIHVISDAGGGSTSGAYDGGGGSGWNAGGFAHVLLLGYTGLGHDIIPHWTTFTFVWDSVLGALAPYVGTTLYLEHAAGTHSNIAVRAANIINLAGSEAPADDFLLGAATFTAVAAAPNYAAQEFLAPSVVGAVAAAADLVASIMDGASQTAIGQAVTAFVDPMNTNVVVLDSAGADLITTDVALAFTIWAWDAISTAVVLTPGSDH